MNKFEIINELKQCKGNRAALEFAVKAVEAVCCGTCCHYNLNTFEYPCSKCDSVNVSEYWEADV